MRTPRQKTGTPRLSEAARHVILPAGITKTAWPSVEQRCKAFGITFDEWQRGAGKALLALNDQGLYAADTSVISIPRQVGKTFLLGAIVFALCLMHPGMTVIWTAHHSRTANETFGDMQGLARLPKIAAQILAVRVAAGEQGVLFTNGSRILFGAREHGFGRGFTGVDVLVFDEAQQLSEAAMDNMVPTTNQASTGNPLILLAGTPPDPVTDRGDVFGKLRSEAIEAGSGAGDTFYLEFSADPDADLRDRSQWARANPSYPVRTQARAFLRMLKHLGDESFRREALGIWPDTNVTEPPVISADEWESARVDKAPTDGLPCYGVRYSPDGAAFAVSVALKRNDAPVFVEVIDRESTSVGVGGLADWLAARWADSGCIVIDGKSHEGALVEALLDRGVPPKWIKKPTMTEIATAYPMFLEWVRTGRLQHSGQEGLAESVNSAARRKIGNLGGWGFQPNSLEGDVVPAESAVLAVAGTTLTKRKPNSPAAKSGRAGAGRASSGRRATVR